MFQPVKFILILSLTLFFVLSCGVNKMEQQFNDFLQSHIEKVKPLMKDINLSYWNASISGVKEDYDKVAKFELLLSGLSPFYPSHQETGVHETPEQPALLFRECLHPSFDCLMADFPCFARPFAVLLHCFVYSNFLGRNEKEGIECPGTHAPDIRNLRNQIFILLPRFSA